MPQRSACKEYESFMETVSKGLCCISKNMVSTSRVSTVLLTGKIMHFMFLFLIDVWIKVSPDSCVASYWLRKLEVQHFKLA